jgi:RNA polymerase sigma-70 factor (ECF subfamily)
MNAPSTELELRPLVIAGLEGDVAAYKALLAKLSGHLRAYFKGRLARIGLGPVDAEDLVQEVLIAIHTHRHTYDPVQLFTPWAYAIARYKFLDYLCRTKASMKDVPIEQAEAVMAGDDTAGVESTLDLERLMAQVAPKVRQVIQFVKVDGLTFVKPPRDAGCQNRPVKVSVRRGPQSLGAPYQ